MVTAKVYGRLSAWSCLHDNSVSFCLCLLTFCLSSLRTWYLDNWNLSRRPTIEYTDPNFLYYFCNLATTTAVTTAYYVCEDSPSPRSWLSKEGWISGVPVQSLTPQKLNIWDSCPKFNPPWILYAICIHVGHCIHSIYLLYAVYQNWYRERLLGLH